MSCPEAMDLNETQR